MFLVKTVMIPAKCRGVVAGVVGCLLLVSMLGATPFQGAEAPKDSLVESSLVSAERAVTPVEVVTMLSTDVHASGDAYEYLTLTEATRFRLSRIANRLGVITHTIEDGESSWTIAQRFSTDIGTLQALNPGMNPDNLVPGDSIRVVPNFSGLVHTVQPGDTIESIAAAYGASLDEVLRATGIMQEETLAIDAQVFVPGGRIRPQVASRGASLRRASPEPAPESASTEVAVAAAPPPAPAPAPAPTKKGGWIWPLTGSLFFSEYGYREGGFHRGLDMAAPVGTPVVAAVGGTVVASGWDGGYGYCVTIDHGDGLVTKYAHASKLLVDVGQVVSQGQQVILVGSTGNSTGPHLHFEVQVNGSAVNPRQYLP